MFEVHIFLLNEGSSFLTLRFENDVNMYGTQTVSQVSSFMSWFENDVKYLKQWKLQNSCTANNQKVLSELRMM